MTFFLSPTGFDQPPFGRRVCHVAGDERLPHGYGEAVHTIFSRGHLHVFGGDTPAPSPCRGVMDGFIVRVGRGAAVGGDDCACVHAFITWQSPPPCSHGRGCSHTWRRPPCTCRSRPPSACPHIPTRGRRLSPCWVCIFPCFEFSTCCLQMALADSPPHSRGFARLRDQAVFSACKIQMALPYVRPWPPRASLGGHFRCSSAQIIRRGRQATATRCAFQLRA